MDLAYSSDVFSRFAWIWFFQAEKTEKYQSLRVLKLCGIKDLKDTTIGKISHKSPNITFLDLNGVQTLTDQALTELASLPLLKTVFLNGTQTLSVPALDQYKKANPTVTVVRDIVKMSDPKDCGLRIPYPPLSVINDKFKAGGKKKKKK